MFNLDAFLHLVLSDNANGKGTLPVSRGTEELHAALSSRPKFFLKYYYFNKKIAEIGAQLRVFK